MYKMISFSNNFIFIHINKTAGSSIEVALKDYGIKKPLIKEGNFPHSQHFKYDDYKDYIGDNFTNFYTFTVVRNPWDRVVSYYHNGAITKNLNFNNWVIDRYKNNNFLDHMRMYQPCTEWFDKVDKIRGLDITLVISSLKLEHSLELLKQLNFPFKAKGDN